MKSDIKKKFIDILFEPDEDEEYEDIQPDRIESKPLEKEDITISAKDILYRKSGHSAFIDLDAPLKKVKEQNETSGDFEPSAQISPIFGVIKESKKVENVSRTVNEAQINKPEDSHLEIIISPIYGYGTRDEKSAGKEEAPVYDSDAELHRLLDSKEDHYADDHTYDDFDDADDLNLFNYGEDE